MITDGVCLPNIGFGINRTVLNPKMVEPMVSTRIEQRENRAFLVQHSTNVRAFLPIAIGAGISKVVGMVGAIVLAANDVLNVKWKVRGNIGLAAVFAAKIGAGSNQLTNSR